MHEYLPVWVGNIILFPIKKDEFSPVQNLHPSLLDEAATTASTLCVEPDLLEMIQELLLRKLTEQAFFMDLDGLEKVLSPEKARKLILCLHQVYDWVREASWSLPNLWASTADFVSTLSWC